MAIEKRHYKDHKNTSYYYWGGGLFVIIVVLLILKSAGVLGNKDAIFVETEIVKKRNISELITASGKLKPEKELSISSDVSGEIIELTVIEGDKVKKGDLLLRIKPDEYKSMVEDAVAAYNSSLAGLENSRANLDQAKAMYEKSKTLYERYKSMKEKSAVSETEFERVESEYLSAKALLESAEQGIQTSKYSIVSARARKEKALESLNKTAIYAPIDGVITRLNNQLGERVVGTAQMQGTVILRIADLSKMVVNIEVNENDIIRISKGDTADIEVDAFADQKFKGLVTEIANSSKDVAGGADQITTFEVKIKLLPESYKQLLDSTKEIQTPFRPGMSAMVDIKTSRVMDVLSVPILSVTTRSLSPEGVEVKKRKKDDKENEKEEKKDEVVFLYEKGKLKMTKVKIGIQDDYYIQIIEGITEGQEVVSGPYSTVSKILKEGQEVRKNTKKKND